MTVALPIPGQIFDNTDW